MEVLTRIAEEKYVKSKLCSSLTDAIRRLLENHCLEKFVKCYDFIVTWREKKY